MGAVFGIGAGCDAVAVCAFAAELVTVFADCRSNAALSLGLPIEFGIQPINAAMPTPQNKVKAMPAIQITAWGKLPDCGSNLLTCVSMRASFEIKPCQTTLPSMP
jgi:hypothetical protein